MKSTFALPLVCALLLSACSNSGGSSEDSHTTVHNPGAQNPNVDPIAIQIVEDSKQAAKQHAKQIFTIYSNHLLYSPTSLRQSLQWKLEQKNREQTPHLAILKMEAQSFRFIHYDRAAYDLNSFANDFMDLIVAAKSEQMTNDYNRLSLLSLQAEVEGEMKQIVQDGARQCQDGVASNFGSGMDSALARPPSPGIFPAKNAITNPMDILLFSSGFLTDDLIGRKDWVTYLMRLKSNGMSAFHPTVNPSEVKSMLWRIEDSEKRQASERYVFDNKADSDTVKEEFRNLCVGLNKTLQTIASGIEGGTPFLSQADAAQMIEAGYEETLKRIDQHSKILQEANNIYVGQNNPIATEDFRRLYEELTNNPSFSAIRETLSSLSEGERNKLILLNFYKLQEFVNSAPEKKLPPTVDFDVYTNGLGKLRKLSGKILDIQSEYAVVFDEKAPAEAQSHWVAYLQLIQLYSVMLFNPNDQDLVGLREDTEKWLSSVISNANPDKSKHGKALLEFGAALKLMVDEL